MHPGAAGFSARAARRGSRQRRGSEGPRLVRGAAWRFPTYLARLREMVQEKSFTGATEVAPYDCADDWDARKYAGRNFSSAAASILLSVVQRRRTVADKRLVDEVRPHLLLILLFGLRDERGAGEEVDGG